MQILTLAGRLGQDARRIDKGNNPDFEVWGFSVAHSRSVKKDGAWDKETVWHNAVYILKAESKLPQYLRKGTAVALTGDVVARAYTDRNGEARSSLDVQVKTLELLGGGEAEASSVTAKNKSASAASGGSDNDFPF